MHVWMSLVILLTILTACSVTVNESSGGTSSTPAPTITRQDEAADVTQEVASAGEESLTGHLIFADDIRGIQQYDFETGEVSTLYAPPPRAVTRNLAVSPDGTQIVFSYAPPPPEENALQFGFTDLYVMPLDGSSEPRPFLEGDDNSELYFLPSWSPDGEYLYYSHILPNPSQEGASLLQTERITYPDGEPEVVVEGGFSARLSNDGMRMVYVKPNAEQGRDDLFVSNPDGSDSVVVIENNFFSAIDAPIFTPDGEYVIFSAVTSDSDMKKPSKSFIASLFDTLLGVQVAEAHSVPSDLWRVPVTGGRATQITFIYAINLWPEFAPDGERMVLLSSNRIYIVDINSDGTQLTTLLDQGASGTMAWVP